jgi:hypothetical protein
MGVWLLLDCWELLVFGRIVGYCDCVFVLWQWQPMAHNSESFILEIYCRRSMLILGGIPQISPAELVVPYNFDFRLKGVIASSQRRRPNTQQLLVYYVTICFLEFA